MKIRLMLPFSVEKLTDIINHTFGCVILHLPENRYYDLKNDVIAIHLLKQEISKGHSVEIYLSDTKDYFKFVYFMIGNN